MACNTEENAVLLYELSEPNLKNKNPACPHL